MGGTPPTRTRIYFPNFQSETILAVIRIPIRGTIVEEDPSVAFRQREHVAVKTDRQPGAERMHYIGKLFVR